MECLGSGKGKRRHINSRIKLKTRPIGRFGGIDIYIWLLSYQFCMNLKLQEENSTMKYAKLVKIKVRETQTSVRPLAFIWQKVLLSKSLFQLSSHPLCSYVMEGTPLQGSPVAKPPNCAFLSHLLCINNLWKSYRIIGSGSYVDDSFCLHLTLTVFLWSHFTQISPFSFLWKISATKFLPQVWETANLFFRKFLILWVFSQWVTFYIHFTYLSL